MDPKIDFAFKQLFAGKGKESKILLVDLLNSIFNSNNDEITDIIYLNPYTDKEYDDTKQSISNILLSLPLPAKSCLNAKSILGSIKAVSYTHLFKELHSFFKNNYSQLDEKYTFRNVVF